MKLDFLVNFFPFVNYKVLTESDDFTEVMNGGDFIVFEGFDVFGVFDFDLMFDDGGEEREVFFLFNEGGLLDEFVRGVNFGEDFVFLVEEK